MKKFRLAVLASHVVQYQAPLYKLLASHPDIELKVYYCSTDGANEYFDPDMRTTLKWDLSLLDGYDYEFLTNFSPLRNRRHFLRYIHPPIYRKLREFRPDAVVLILGWGFLTSWLTVAACRILRIPLLLNGDSSSIPELRGLVSRIRDRILRTLFAHSAAFLVTGTRNADYYLHYGADRRRFFPMPFASDNDRFATDSRLSPEERCRLRQEWSAEVDATVFLFSGKLTPRKNPGHLLEALSRTKWRNRIHLVFMGDGELRGELESAARRQNLPATFLGFVNQKEMPAIYGAADVLVLPSTYEPRGIVLNEAMASGMTAIVSDRVGSVGEGDLLIDGQTGFVVPLNDFDALAARLDQLASDRNLLDRMKRSAAEKIASWNYAADVEGILQALHFITEGKNERRRPRFLEGSRPQN